MSYDTREEILKLGEIDPELAEFFRKNPVQTPDYSQLQTFIDSSAQRIAAAQALLGEPPSTIKISERKYTARDGASLRARLYQPSSPPSDGSPLIVVYHGGGFCVGAPESEEQTCRAMVQAFGATCVSMQYRLAPTFPFPYAANDAWDGLKWAAENATALGADPKAGFVVGGTSAGGNLAAVVAHHARDQNLSPPLTGQWLAIPALCPRDRMPSQYAEYALSYEQNEKAPVLPLAAIEMFMSGYKPDDGDGENFAVFNHPKGHKGLPKAFFQVDGMDPLRDEALIYERVLRTECDVDTKLNVYPGLPHGHWGFFPMLKSADKFRREQVQGFGWLLGKEPKIVNIEAVPTAV